MTDEAPKVVQMVPVGDGGGVLVIASDDASEMTSIGLGQADLFALAAHTYAAALMGCEDGELEAFRQQVLALIDGETLRRVAIRAATAKANGATVH